MSVGQPYFGGSWNTSSWGVLSTFWSEVQLFDWCKCSLLYITLCAAFLLSCVPVHHSCLWLISSVGPTQVYALPQRNVSATGRPLFAVANWKSVFVDCEYMLVTQQQSMQSMQTQWSLPNTYYMTCCFCSAVPDYAKIQGNTTHTVSTNFITGLSNVTFTYTVTSHWSSLAIVKSVYGQLTKGLSSGDTVVDALDRLFTHSISLLVSAVWSTLWLCICLWLVVCFVCVCMPC